MDLCNDVGMGLRERVSVVASMSDSNLEIEEPQGEEKERLPTLLEMAQNTRITDCQ
jgi:hypothetical protein